MSGPDGAAGSGGSDRAVLPRVAELPDPAGPWDAPGWERVPVLPIDRFHPASSTHRPRARARLAHDGRTIGILFRTEDHDVRVRHGAYQDPVYQDSCVEIFLEPVPGKGYLNFEVNALGTMRVFHIEDPRRTPEGFARFRPVEASLGRQMPVRASLSGELPFHRPGAVTWTVGWCIPVAILEVFAGPMGCLNGRSFRGNLHICADGRPDP